MLDIDRNSLLKEFGYRTSRSGGNGGQNVNKVSSKVELFWNINQTTVFNPEEKDRLLKKLENKITKEGFLQIICEQDRSQLRNKETAIKKMFNLLYSSLMVQKTRKATKPSNTVIAKRLDAKKKTAIKKINRLINWD